MGCIQKNCGDVMSKYAGARESPRGARALTCSNQPLHAMATAASDQEQLLKLLAERGSFDSYDLSHELHRDHQTIVGVIKSLHSLGEVSRRSN